MGCGTGNVHLGYADMDMDVCECARPDAKVNAMNFSVDCSEKKSPSLRRFVPLRVLVKEWGDLGSDAFQQIDVVLLLLQGIQLADEERVGAH